MKRIASIAGAIALLTFTGTANADGGNVAGASDPIPCVENGRCRDLSADLRAVATALKTRHDTISAALKTRHETVKNSISNIR